jgi:DNA-binding beta-propeller fold protein YncE
VVGGTLTFMWTRVGSALAALALVAPASAVATTPAPEPEPGVTRPVILVGNNWEGTTDVVDPDTFERLDRINVIPDKAERLAEIGMDPVKQGFYVGVRELIGEGNDQYNDDVFSSNDGRTIFVSRPSFADVVAIDLETKRIKWRAPVDGYRSDHMTISEDGTRLYVSASTGNVVHELDTATGRRTGGFPSGDSPHENVIMEDGKTLLHASIGRVYLPVDRAPLAKPSRGGEFFQVVDRTTGKVLKRLDMGQKMAEAGYPNFSSAVRPMALAPDQRFLYFQLSFFHGFVEYDLQRDRVTRIARLPLSEEVAMIPREQYLLDSAHHGLAMDGKGEKLCVAGTMSDYGAIVSRRSFAARVLDVGKKPYWSTNSADGKYCYISASQSDHVAVISYETEEILTTFPVGRHPQRVRNGVARVSVYPQGRYGERFRLGLFHERSPIGVRGGTERFGCRAEGARQLRLQRCRVRVTSGSTLVGTGERVGRDQRAFAVNVKLTQRGRSLLRRAA